MLRPGDGLVADATASNRWPTPSDSQPSCRPSTRPSCRPTWIRWRQPHRLQRPIPAVLDGPDGPAPPPLPPCRSSAITVLPSTRTVAVVRTKPLRLPPLNLGNPTRHRTPALNTLSILAPRGRRLAKVDDRVLRSVLRQLRTPRRDELLDHIPAGRNVRSDSHSPTSRPALNSPSAQL